MDGNRLNHDASSLFAETDDFVLNAKKHALNLQVSLDLYMEAYHNVMLRHLEDNIWECADSIAKVDSKLSHLE